MMNNDLQPGDLVAIDKVWLENMGAVVCSSHEKFVYGFVINWNEKRRGWNVLLTIPLRNNRWAGRLLLSKHNNSRGNYKVVSRKE